MEEVKAENEADDESLFIGLAGTYHGQHREWKGSKHYLKGLSPQIGLHVFVILCYTVGLILYARTKLAPNDDLDSGLYCTALETI